MKSPVNYLLILLLLGSSLAYAQDVFKANKNTPTTEELKILNQKFKKFRSFEISPADLKSAIKS